MGGLKRDIGVIGAGFIALNGIIGAGIFAAPKDLAQSVGAFSPYLFLIFGALALSIAVVMADLASRFDGAGGPVEYAGAAFGPFVGFQAGWLLYLARLAAFAANTNAFLTYLAYVMPGVDAGVLRAGVIAALIAVFAALNIVGVRHAARTLSIFTVLKVAPLLIFAAWGVMAYSQALPAPTPPRLEDVGEASLLAIYALTGFEICTLTSGETRSATRTVPLALIATIVAASLLYFLIQLAYVAIIGEAEVSAPLAAAAQALAGPWGASAITAAALLSIGANLFAQFLTTPRITFALAEQRALPGWFGRVHSRFATPSNSIVTLGVIAGALAISGAFVWLAVMSALARLVVYLLCVGAFARVSSRIEGARRRSLPLVAAAVAVPLCLWAAAQATPRAWAFLAGFALLGAALYALARWRRRKPSPI